MEVSKVRESKQAVIIRNGVGKTRESEFKIKNKSEKPKPVDIIARKPLEKDTFQKEQPVDKAGKVINKNGIINN